MKRVLFAIGLSAIIASNAFSQATERDLSEAIKANNIKKVEQLLKDNPKLADKNIEFFGYPLLYSLENKKYPVVKALLDAGVSTNIKDKGGENAFHCLARAGTISKANLETIIYIIKALKAKSCSINAFSNAGFTPIHLAVMTNFSLKELDNTKAFVEELIANGADFKTEPKDEKKTPLLIKVISTMAALPPNKDGVVSIRDAESFELMKLLIEKGYNVNVMDPDKNTPLIVLMKKKLPDEPKMEMVKYLLEQKANPKLKNKAKESALSIAGKDTPLYELLKNPPKPAKKK